MRAVEAGLLKMRVAKGIEKKDKAEIIAAHLNRVIANLVFSDPSLKDWKSDTVTPDELRLRATTATLKIFDQVAR